MIQNDATTKSAKLHGEILINNRDMRVFIFACCMFTPVSMVTRQL